MEKIIWYCCLLYYVQYCSGLAQDIFEMYHNYHHSNFGTYNNMQNQTGFCKMTGFDTISRNTSQGPPLFTSGRIEFGVGLSGYEFGNQNLTSLLNKPEGALVCGMCINITSINNLPRFNFDLDSFDNVNTTTYHIAMIFDQCNDLVCTDSFLDIDVYTEHIFHKSNTYNLSWIAIDCPVYSQEKMEYLLCTTDTCNHQDIKYLKTSSFQQLFDPSYFSIVVRNMKRPIKTFYIWYRFQYHELSYVPGIGYQWNNDIGYFDKEEYMVFKLIDIFNDTYFSNFSFIDILHSKPLDGYKGGILLH